MNPAFKILNSDDPLHRAEWIACWNQWPAREVQAHPAYIELFLADGDRACAAILETDATCRVLYPFVLRGIPERLGETARLKDITSAYGYGGPCTWGKGLSEKETEEFWSHLDAWASENNVVTEFVRFGLFEQDGARYPGERITRQDNIVVPLTGTDDEIWSGFDRKVRKNVNRAVREGLKVEIDLNSVRFEEFYDIYVSTMDRRGASDSYYFPRRFFESIHAELDGQYAYANVFQGSKVVSTELVLISSESVYSFLGGTVADAFHLRPNDLLKFEVIRWASNLGKKYFVLGGGYSKGDGIERYKKAFAPGSAIAFTTGQRVLDPDKNLLLVESVPGGASVAGYFPAYRSQG